MLHEIRLKWINNYCLRFYKDLRLYCKYFVNQIHNELTSSTRFESALLLTIIAQGREYHVNYHHHHLQSGWMNIKYTRNYAKKRNLNNLQRE